MTVRYASSRMATGLYASRSAKPVSPIAFLEGLAAPGRGVERPQDRRDVEQQPHEVADDDADVPVEHRERATRNVKPDEERELDEPR